MSCLFAALPLGERVQVRDGANYARAARRQAQTLRAQAPRAGAPKAALHTPMQPCSDHGRLVMRRKGCLIIPTAVPINNHVRDSLSGGRSFGSQHVMAFRGYRKASWMPTIRSKTRANRNAAERSNSACTRRTFPSALPVTVLLFLTRQPTYCSIFTVTTGKKRRRLFVHAHTRTLKTSNFFSIA